MAEITWALKEWAVAVEALLTGDLMLLIRKGGIHETKPVFNVPSDRALLFPTYEHQSAAAMREPWRSRVSSQTVPQLGDDVALLGWAEITHQLQLTGPDLEQRLQPFHIWTDAWLTERLAWKPERPAYVLLLRVHRFATPLQLTYAKRYGGCRSWIELADVPTWSESLPVMTAAAYQEQVAALEAAIAPITTSTVVPQ
ncbi:MAG: DUF1802 family protein [Leptolyngbya sp. SIOISBB]|nr:DUF1802 family protein [Leptolyngbya sp. SIOISBB]